MRFIAALLMLTVLATPALAQEDAPTPVAFLDVGPGFFQSLSEDSTSAEIYGVTQFIGAGFYLGDKLAFSARVNFDQQDQKSVVTSVSGWLTGYPTGQSGGIYLSLGVGTKFDGNIKISGRGGYQTALFADVMGFVEAEGQSPGDEAINSIAQGNMGLRVNFGHQ